jgi:hypothetical protein
MIEREFVLHTMNLQFYWKRLKKLRSKQEKTDCSVFLSLTVHLQKNLLKGFPDVLML